MAVAELQGKREAPVLALRAVGFPGRVGAQCDAKMVYCQVGMKVPKMIESSSGCGDLPLSSCHCTRISEVPCSSRCDREAGF